MVFFITTPGPTTTTTAPDNQGENRMQSHDHKGISCHLLLTTVQINGGGNDTPSGGLEPGAIVGIIFGLLIVLVLGVAIVVVVLLVAKHRKTGGKYSTSSNVAYTSQRTNEDIAVSQPLAESNVETKDGSLVTGDTAAADESSKYQPLTMLYYDTIDESQLTVADVPKTDEEVLHRNIETITDKEFLQPSTSVLYDTIDDNNIMTEVLQRGSEHPAALSMNEFPDIKSETELPITTENVAYNSSYPLPVCLEAQRPSEVALLTAVNLVQNVAYKPTSIPLMPNVAYESHVHQGIENQDEYDYICNNNLI